MKVQTALISQIIQQYLIVLYIPLINLFLSRALKFYCIISNDDLRPPKVHKYKIQAVIFIWTHKTQLHKRTFFINLLNQSGLRKLDSCSRVRLSTIPNINYTCLTCSRTYLRLLQTSLLRLQPAELENRRWSVFSLWLTTSEALFWCCTQMH